MSDEEPKVTHQFTDTHGVTVTLQPDALYQVVETTVVRYVVFGEAITFFHAVEQLTHQ